MLYLLLKRYILFRTLFCLCFRWSFIQYLFKRCKPFVTYKFLDFIQGVIPGTLLFSNHSTIGGPSELSRKLGYEGIRKEFVLFLKWTKTFITEFQVHPTQDPPSKSKLQTHSDFIPSQRGFFPQFTYENDLINTKPFLYCICTYYYKPFLIK